MPDTEFAVWLNHSEKATFEIHETWPKQTCRNRYRIATANGPLVLSIPVVKPYGNHTQTQHILIDRKSEWNRIHWRTIESAYNKSPFFLYYRDEYETLFNEPPVRLIDFNLAALRTSCRLAGTGPEFNLSGSFEKTPGNACVDMRQNIMPKKPVDHPFRIRNFEPYIQVFSDRIPFIPNLSILDLLFNLGPETAAYISRHIPDSKYSS